MAKKHDNWLTDEEVEKEIERLKASPDVKLAKKKENLDYRRRNLMYCLRTLEKKGKELRKAGITIEMIEQMYNEIDE